MSRRKKSNTADLLLELVAMLPWWAGVLLALASYLVLHGVASQPVQAPAQSAGSVTVMVTQTIWTTLAGVGQYVLPGICLLGASISAWRRRKRQSLLADVAGSGASDALDGMSWREFEMLVGEGFRQQGFQVLETGGGGADGGVDILLTKPGDQGGEKFLVQCKQWRAYKVGVSVVRELYGVMAARGATGGFVVTSGRFTAEAVSFASGRNVTLMDGPQLHAFLRQAQARVTRSTDDDLTTPVAQPLALPGQAQVQACPLCAKPMALRTAKRGRNAGGSFWGCTGYPTCRGIRPSG